MLRMSHADAFQKILRKHKAKMEHWNTRSLNNLNLKNEKPDEVMETTETSNKQLAADRVWNRYFNLHSPKSIEKKIRKPPIEENGERLIRNLSVPLSESYQQSLDRVPSDSQVPSVPDEIIRVKSDGKTVKLYEKIRENNILTNSM